MTDDTPDALPVIPMQDGGSPLLEADPMSLDEFMARVNVAFSKPPLEITTEGPKSDLAIITQYYRNFREKYLTDEARKAAEAKEKKPRTKKASAASKMALSDILGATLELPPPEDDE